MDRATSELTTQVLKAAAVVVLVTGGSYLLLLGGRHFRPGCFGFAATCSAGAPAAIEACVNAQYAAVCPLWGRVLWLAVWLGYCGAVVWLLMGDELRKRWAQPSSSSS